MKDNARADRKVPKLGVGYFIVLGFNILAALCGLESARSSWNAFGLFLVAYPLVVVQIILLMATVVVCRKLWPTRKGAVVLNLAVILVGILLNFGAILDCHISGGYHMVWRRRPHSGPPARLVLRHSHGAWTRIHTDDGGY